jgi:hypothetical protein
MGNDKYVAFEGTPRDLSLWTERKIADVAHATGVALTVKPKGIFELVDEPPWVLGFIYTSSLSGGDIVGWLHQQLRSGRVWFIDLDWPERREWFNNNDGRGWEPVK